jgi:hypothetical protein
MASPFFFVSFKMKKSPCSLNFFPLSTGFFKTTRAHFPAGYNPHQTPPQDLNTAHLTVLFIIQLNTNVK